MSAFVCPDCGARDELFGNERAAETAARLVLPLLGEIPIEPALREGISPISMDANPTGKSTEQRGAHAFRSAMATGGSVRL